MQEKAESGAHLTASQRSTYLDSRHGDPCYAAKVFTYDVMCSQWKVREEYLPSPDRYSGYRSKAFRLPEGTIYEAPKHVKISAVTAGGARYILHQGIFRRNS